jgi:membrane complex biogenesis BtpA family protein
MTSEGRLDALRSILGVDKPLIAMCHLLGLPGRPKHDVTEGIDGIVEKLAKDVSVLQDAGVDGLLFCNENDLPYQLRVGPEVTAAMAAAIGRLRSDIRLPFGVDLLWDPKATLAVARATGAAFAREVFTGVFETDMGLMAPELGDLAGYRHAIGAERVALFANITPEFSRSVSARPVVDRARGAAYLGVDALLISGPQAGMSVEMSDLREAKQAAPEIPVIANTGVTHENVGEVLAIADGIIVGTSLKVDGSTWNPVEPDRARRMVRLVADARGHAMAS